MERFSSVNFVYDKVTSNALQSQKIEHSHLQGKRLGPRITSSDFFFFFLLCFIVLLRLDYISQDTPLLRLIHDWVKQ